MPPLPPSLNVTGNTGHSDAETVRRPAPIVKTGRELPAGERSVRPPLIAAKKNGNKTVSEQLGLGGNVNLAIRNRRSHEMCWVTHRIAGPKLYLCCKVSDRFRRIEKLRA